jgi:hypothetical protein
MRKITVPQQNVIAAIHELKITLGRGTDAGRNW